MARRRSKITVFLWIIAGIGLAGIIYYLIFRPSKAGLQVQTGDIPVDIVLAGQTIGTSPFFNEELEPGTYILTLQPQDNLYLPFERKITLSDNFLTVVEWHPDTIPDRSWGIFLEPQPLTSADQVENTADGSVLDITSSPDNIVLKIDETESQVTPQVIDGMSAQTHTLNFSLPSYESLTREINVIPDEHIKVFVKLAKAQDEIIQSHSTTQSSGWDENQDQVRLALDTSQPIGSPLKVLSTAFYIDKKEVLAIREKPDLNSNVVENVEVGATLSYLGDETADFYKVQFGQKTAWAEKKFVQFVK